MERRREGRARGELQVKLLRGSSGVSVPDETVVSDWKLRTVGQRLDDVEESGSKRR